MAAIFATASVLAKCADSFAVAPRLNEGMSVLSDPLLSLELGSAPGRVLDSIDCTVNWIGTDNESAFETNLGLLSGIPSEHDTLAGRSQIDHSSCSR